MTGADVIFLAHTASDALHAMTLEAIRSLRASEPEVGFTVTIMESNPRWEPLRHPYEGCQVLQPDGPFNYNKFCNLGIQATRNPWVALCNNDLVFHPGWFSEILKVHAEKPSLQSFSPFNDYQDWHSTLFKGEAPALSVNYRVNYEVAGWCLVLRREVLRKLELSERVSFWYSDDVYAEALNRNGIRHCLVKASKVDHLGGATLKTLPPAAIASLTVGQRPNYHKGEAPTLRLATLAANPGLGGEAEDPAGLLAVPCRVRLYGLEIESPLPLPCPSSRGSHVDLTLKAGGPLPPLATTPGAWTRTWSREPWGWLLRYGHPGGRYLEFHFSPDGSSISIHHHGALAWPNPLTIVLGPVLAVALHLLGKTLLHGGGAFLGGGLLILGASEAGKSTLKAALVAAGCPLLCEEMAVLDWLGGRPCLQPGHPLMKFSSASALALGLEPASLPPVFPADADSPDERWLDSRRLAGGFYDHPAPLRVIYLLAGRRAGLRAPLFEPLPPAMAAIQLSKHLYARDWLHLDPQVALERASGLAAAVPVRQVWLPDGLERLGASAEGLMADALALDGGAHHA